MATLLLSACANTAAQYLEVLDSGESLSNQQWTDALAYVNSMLDVWSVDDPMLLSAQRYLATLTAATQSYTIGTGAAFNITRPVEIVSAALILPSGPGGPIDVVNAKQWTQIEDRQSSSWKVKYLFYDRQNNAGVGNVYFSPIPLGGQAELLSFAPLPQFVDVNTTALTLPGPGYNDLYIFGTALRMAAQMGVPIPASVQEGWTASAERVRMQNAKLFGIPLPEMMAKAAQ